MIDLHTHVFNAAYLPLQGILEARGIPKLAAWPLARLLEAWIEYEELLPGSDFSPALNRQLYPSAEAGRNSKGLLAEENDPITVFAKTVEGQFLESHANDIEDALAALEFEPEFNGGSVANDVPPINASASLTLELLAMPAGDLRNRLWKLLDKLARVIRGGRAVVQWIVLLLQKESDIVATLCKTYPEARLFVHHMMDLGPHYSPSRCSYPFEELQLNRVRRLSEKYKGVLLPFVAYSPFRPDGVELVERWLERGCAGVKFYPPSGYRPIGNTTDDLQNSKHDPTVVDERNLKLFQLCVYYDIPIFAHCQPGEFERRKGSGCLSHPDGWRRVLETPGLENLRLCLGHAGGEGWTAAEGAEDEDAKKHCKSITGFVAGVVHLCTTYPNVYAEFGCMETILEQDGVSRNNLTKRLCNYVAQYGDAFGRHIVYGSDWHMLAKTPHFGGYDDAFKRLFRANPALMAYESYFFEKNALKFLNLRGFLDRNAGALTTDEKTYLEALEANTPED